MITSGPANVLAALIIAAAILWSGGFGGNQRSGDEEYAEFLTRAVGDIRNDIVVNCGCCDEGLGRAADKSF